MKILYIDTRAPGHNAELHVDFISYMHKAKHCEIIPYGNNLKTKFSNSISIDEGNIEAQLVSILLKNKPDPIMTYNKNGSGYESLRDNVSFYKK